MNIYLDNSATTKISPEVLTAMSESLAFFGNASSLHHEGHLASQQIEAARINIANLIGAESSEIIFTSGGTESNNIAINIGRELALSNPEKNEIIVSAIEHPSIIEAAKRLKQSGIIVHFIPVDAGGRIKIDEFKKVLSNKTALVSIMHANNETGTIQDIRAFADLAHEFEAYIHTDAVQTLGKIEFDVNKLGVDYVSFSAHKIRGPKGVGAFYQRFKTPYWPLLIGGHQERGKRAGTYNTTGIVGFGAAAKLAQATLSQYAEKVTPVKNKLREEILDQIPNTIVNGNQDYALPNILNVSFPGAEGESIILYLDNFGVEVSTGSACAAGDTKPSHVLMAILDDPELAHGSVRFSFGLDNTSDEVDYIMQYLPKIINNLRQISTIGSGE